MSESVNEAVSNLLARLEQQQRQNIFSSVPTLLMLVGAISAGGVAFYKVGENSNQIHVLDSRLDVIEREHHQVIQNTKTLDFLIKDNLDSQKARAICRDKMESVEADIKSLFTMVR